MTAAPGRVGRQPHLRGPLAARCFVCLIEDDVDLGGLEAGQFDLEIEIDQRLQLDRKDLPIPARLLGQAVVGQNIGAFFGVAEV